MNPNLSFSTIPVPAPMTQPAQPLSFSTNPQGQSAYGVPAPVVPGSPATPVAPAATGVMSSSGFQPVGAAPGMVAGQALNAALSQTAGQQGGFLGSLGKTFMNKDGGFNLGALGGAAQVVGGLGALWQGIQANGIARDSLKFQKEAYQDNRESQRASYNMAIEDRMRARASQYGDPAYAARAIDRYTLKD